MKTIMIVVAVVFAFSIFYGLGYQGLKGVKNAPDKDSIAKVNGKEIDHTTYARTLSNMYGGQKKRPSPQEMVMLQTAALNETIDFTVLLQEARKKTGATNSEVDAAIRQIMEANKMNNLDHLNRSLKQMGTDYSSFRRMIKDEITVSKMVSKIKSDVVISPNDLREVKVRHVLIRPKYIYIEDEKKRKTENDKADMEARLKAEDVLAKARQGQSFSKLAITYSEDPGSKDKGGDLGYFTTGSFAPEFEKVAFSLKPGEISNVFKTVFGYHVVKVEDTRLRRVATAEGKDLSQIILEEKQNNTFSKWFFELKSKAKIEIINTVLKAYSLALSGNFNEAVTILQGAVSEDPYDPYKHLFLGDLYFRSGKMELAIFEYKRVAELGGSSADLLMALGSAYLAAKKAGVKTREGEDLTKMAVEQFRRASIISGDDKEMHIKLKDLFSGMGYSTDVKRENNEIKRIEKKEKFEEEIRGQATRETMDIVE